MLDNTYIETIGLQDYPFFTNSPNVHFLIENFNK